MVKDYEEMRLKVSRLQRRQWYLAAAIIATTLAIVLTRPSLERNRHAELDVLDVQRINIREPDGTIRLSLSNRANFPGAIVRNEEHAHPRDVAGMLFFNDEGTESGGLIYSGAEGSTGQPSSGLSLTFDRYQQDQQVQLLGVDDEGKHYGGLSFNDVADGLKRPIFSAADESLHRQGQAAITRRVFLGKSETQDSVLELLDAKGNVRLELIVQPNGGALMRFLDEQGRPTRELTGQ
ncbi:hypothetical protein [Xanthomonas arboricola]|uniref:hypothetical protein n=1 Tax=Xanthomonas arboricola TaxID=56448 RepID=UPI000C82206A|nr:hypothetical protein [Xanthomonas arboricola]PPU28735.1 hypothetical protein XarCFBP6762_05675 [Xanthomonas arboricola]PPU53427.1 hypothetical protein XarbCFBP6827_19080 [Xanthomonas arboricola]SOT99541.1 hypothetical protein CFBP6762_02188 [Xanthomonas arboricola pv. fragariae]